MHNENEIRQALVEICKKRGKQAEISRLLDVAPTTVRRWLDGSEMGSPTVRLLDWYLFGIVPERISEFPSTGRLEFSEDEWAIVGAMARRCGMQPEQWIVARIRDYLALAKVSAQTNLREVERPRGNGTDAALGK